MNEKQDTDKHKSRRYTVQGALYKVIEEGCKPKLTNAGPDPESRADPFGPIILFQSGARFDRFVEDGQYGAFLIHSRQQHPVG